MATAPIPAVYPATATSQDHAPVREERSLVRSFSWRIVASTTVIVLSFIALGKLLVGPLKASGLMRWDERVVATISHHRTPGMNSFTLFFSKLADAPSIVAFGTVVALILVMQRKWRAAGVVPVVLIFELVTFLSVTYPVHRKRPDVVHLGSVPSTGSFPSGHVAATIVLFGLIGLLLFYSRASAALLLPFAAMVLFVVIAVGWSRVYRGMHHPIDVVAGAAMGSAVLGVFRPLIREVVSCYRPATLFSSHPATNPTTETEL